MPFNLAKCHNTFHETSHEGIKPLLNTVTNGPLMNANNIHANNNNNNGNVWEGRSVASSKLRMTTFYAFVDLGPGSEKHILVEIDGLGHSYLEDIDLRQICDKFPSNKTGLKELYDKGPQDAFFLVKFWVCLLFLSLVYPFNLTMTIMIDRLTSTSPTR